MIIIEIFLMIIIAMRKLIMKEVFRRGNIPEQYLPLLQSPGHKRNIYGQDLREKSYLQNEKQNVTTMKGGEDKKKQEGTEKAGRR